MTSTVPPSTDFRSVLLLVEGWALEQHSMALLLISHGVLSAVSHSFWVTLRCARNFCNIGTFPFFPTVSLLPESSFLVFPSLRLTSSRPNISLRNHFFFWGSSEKMSSQRHLLLHHSFNAHGTSLVTPKLLGTPGPWDPLHSPGLFCAKSQTLLDICKYIK